MNGYCCERSLVAALDEHNKALQMLQRLNAERLPMNASDWAEYSRLLKRLNDRAAGWCDFPGHNAAGIGFKPAS